MEPLIIDRDIQLVCVCASSFPEGILAAHQQLHAAIAFSAERRYYGISFPAGNGEIVYRAAAEVLDQADLQKGLELFLLPGGHYTSILISSFINDIPAIGRAFRDLLRDSRIDPQGACVEWYINNEDVRCMVRLQ